MAATSTRTRERTEVQTAITATPRQVAAKSKPHLGAVRNILLELFGPPAQRSFAVRLWDGSVEGPRRGHPPDFTVVLNRPGALRRMLLPPSEIAVAEAYLRDDFDIEGDMEAATGLADAVTKSVSSPRVVPRLVRALLSLPTDDLPVVRPRIGPTAHQGKVGSRLWLAGTRHSRRRDAVAVRSHYDVGNDFYALWLDSGMVYSCAYFERGAETLDTAQEAKLEHICRKLRLKPGERLLDIGCGWGGLVLYAAEHYGVHATGITLSEPQARLARERIKAAGLADRCKIEVRDYRDFPPNTTFDKIVSVGMFEHVGQAKLPVYFEQAYHLLKPGGLFLNHGIFMLSTAAARTAQERVMEAMWRPGSFIWKYVFPDGELVRLGEVIQVAEAARFETRDVESLREHYAQTLRHWVWRLEANREEAVSMVGEQTYRVWRMYMASCAKAFATGKIGIIQVLLSKPDEGGVAHLPLTRADLYQGRLPG